MGGHGSSVNRAFSARTYTRPFENKQNFLDAAKHVGNYLNHAAVDVGTGGLAELAPKGTALADIRDHSGDMAAGILGAKPPPPLPTDAAADTPTDPLPGTDPNGPPTGAAPNPTEASEMAALKRRRLLRMGLLSTITTSPGGLNDAPNLLMPAASAPTGATLLG